MAGMPGIIIMPGGAGRRRQYLWAVRRFVLYAADPGRPVATAVRTRLGPVVDGIPQQLAVEPPANPLRQRCPAWPSLSDSTRLTADCGLPRYAVGDFDLRCPTVMAARVFAAQGRPTYLYSFDHTPYESVNEGRISSYLGAL